MTGKEKSIPTFSLDFRHSYDGKKEVSAKGIVGIAMADIHKGLLSDFTGNELKILLTILAHMDNNGKAFPSQERIADITGISKVTIRKVIKTLLEKKYNGKPLLARELVGGEYRKKSNYYLRDVEINGDLDNESFTKEERISTEDSEDTLTYVIQDKSGNDVEKELKKPKKIKNAKDFVQYFCFRYYQEYEKLYMPNFGRDLKQVKQKIIEPYGYEHLEELIDHTIKVYPIKWASNNYPYPTLGAMYTWLTDKVFNDIDQGAEQLPQINSTHGQREKEFHITDSVKSGHDLAKELF